MLPYKTVYKHILRWTNKTINKSVPFTLDTRKLGIDHILKNETTIRNAYGVRDAARYCFRHSVDSSISSTARGNNNYSLELSFASLKTLYTLSKELKRRSLENIHNAKYNLQSPNQSPFYRVGEVIQHRTVGYRGVVIGWTITESTGKQRLAVLCDVIDVEDYLQGVFPAETLIDSGVFTRIQDPALLRIHNPLIHHHFKGYDQFEGFGQFIPNNELLYRFPNDYKGYTSDIESKAEYNNKLRTSSIKVMEQLNHLMTKVNDIVDTELKSVDNKSSNSLIDEILGDEIDVIKKSLLQYDDDLIIAASVSAGNSDSVDRDEINIASHINRVRTLYTNIDQLLQLRFQSKGISYFEGLSSSDIDNLPYMDAAEELYAYPHASLRVGQVCRHKTLNYRCVIVGYDQRPLIEITGDMASTKDQPFYRVVPDDSDSRDVMLSRNNLYVAQENLIPIEVLDDMTINSRYLNTYFNDYNEHTGRYVAHPRLNFCFNDHDDTNDPNHGTYKRIDRILLDIYSLIKTTFSSSRREHGSTKKKLASISSSSRDSQSKQKRLDTVSMDDLITLLKLVKSRDQAIAVEGLIWFIWMSHNDTKVSKLMRLGLSEMKRGNHSKSYGYFSLAAVTDPLFAEAHNKLAVLHHKADENDQCLFRAQLALKLLPEHFGALSGMALSYEKARNFAAAKDSFRRCLMHLHPWASNVPSRLNALIIQSNDEDDTADVGSSEGEAKSNIAASESESSASATTITTTDIDTSTTNDNTSTTNDK